MRARTMGLVSVAALAVGLAQGMPATAVGQQGGGATGNSSAGGRSAVERAEVQALIPVVDWHQCPERSGYPPRTQCERVPVPVDYDDPEGETLSLWLARRPASQPDERIGTLFANPGGPGESAADFVAFAWRLFPDAVKRRFDIVGIDPRGVARSSPAHCVARGPAPYPRVAYPVTHRQVRRQIAYDRYVRAACAD